MSPFKLSPIIAGLLAVSCSDSNAPAVQEQVFCAGNGIVISDAWIRKPRAGQPMGAAYLSICNGDNESDRLVSVDFSGAEAAELHVTEMDDNAVASMRGATDGIPLPRLSEITLAPGGSHIMLIKPDATLATADEATMTLTFENAPAVTIVLEVRDEMTGGHDNH